MTEWNDDMSAAPKDGTEIIGIFVRQWEFSETPTVYGPWTIAWINGKWMASWDGTRVIEYMSDFGTEYKQPDPMPTHWMRLQPPPTAIAEDA